MLMTTTDSVSGQNLQMLGLVQGNIVRTKDLGRALAAGFRAMAGSSEVTACGTAVKFV